MIIVASWQAAVNWLLRSLLPVGYMFGAFFLFSHTSLTVKEA
jgi:hypothetical protein